MVVNCRAHWAIVSRSDHVAGTGEQKHSTLERPECTYSVSLLPGAGRLIDGVSASEALDRSPGKRRP